MMTTMMIVVPSNQYIRAQTNDITHSYNVSTLYTIPSLFTKMSFSQESIRKLADVTARDVFDKITEDRRFDEVIMNALPKAIEDVMGDVSPELVGELGCEIMGRIGVIEQNGPYSQNNIWKTRYEALFRYVKKNYAESYVDGAEYTVGFFDYDGVFEN